MVLFSDIISDFPIHCWYRENEMAYICITDKEFYKRDMEIRNVEKNQALVYRLNITILNKFFISLRMFFLLVYVL